MGPHVAVPALVGRGQPRQAGQHADRGDGRARAGARPARRRRPRSRCPPGRSAPRSSGRPARRGSRACATEAGSRTPTRPSGASTIASTLWASSVATAAASRCGSSYVSHSSSAKPARLASEATPWISSPKYGLLAPVMARPMARPARLAHAREPVARSSGLERVPHPLAGVGGDEPRAVDDVRDRGDRDPGQRGDIGQARGGASGGSHRRMVARYRTFRATVCANY